MSTDVGLCEGCADGYREANPNACGACAVLGVDARGLRRMCEPCQQRRSVHHHPCPVCGADSRPPPVLKSTTPLHVPHIDHSVFTPEEAAHFYAEAGWYVGPISLRLAKNAGSVLGKGWPEKTSRDPEVIDLWYRRDSERASRAEHPWTLHQLGVFLHVGRSGAIAFDVDHWEHTPNILRRAIEEHQPPFQATRPDQPNRGHYLFALPEGVMLGNSVGDLQTEPRWGEVRGRNGIVVACPVPRSGDGEGGCRYGWRDLGELPLLPLELGRALLGSASRRREFKGAGLYPRKRLHGVLSKLSQAVEGERNSLLFWAACRLGEQTAEGLDEYTAYELLTTAGEELGLAHNEVAATVTSGLATGRWAA
ncbi:MAG: hypothetical protein GEV09_25615 [Pseudonocardiaceae bacterium]|nr:hypothetical protein [Pseudonocardiaceae bacterium]